MWLLRRVQRLAGLVRALLLDPWGSGALVWLVVAVFFGIGLYRYASVTLPNLDVSWLLIASERLLAGGTFLDDFFEVNWPMAIMIYCPGVWLSHLLGIDLYVGLVIFVLMLMGGSVVAAHKSLHQVLPEFPAVTGFLTIAYAWILFFPHHFFGQREHIALALFLPFVIAAAGRVAGRPLETRSAEICISAAAAIGILIKPHFILLPAAIFLVRLLRQRSLRVMWHPDVLTFLLFGSAYLAVLVLIYPGWIEVAQLALQLYSAYDAEMGALLQTAGKAAGLAVLVAIACRFSTLPVAAKSLIFHLTLTVAVAAAIYIIQRKGWSYQFLPAKFTLVLLILAFAGLHLARAKPPQTWPRPAYGFIAAMFLVSVGLLPVARDIWRDYHRLVRYHNAPLTQAVRATMPGEPLFVFSADVRDAFPMALLEKRVWASRFSALWPIPAIVNQLAASPPQQRGRLRSLRQDMVKKTLSDFRRYRPGLVLVSVELNKRWFETDFDFLTFYRADPAFDALWRGYRSIGRAGKFELYVRAEP